LLPAGLRDFLPKPSKVGQEIFVMFLETTPLRNVRQFDEEATMKSLLSAVVILTGFLSVSPKPTDAQTTTRETSPGPSAKLENGDVLDMVKAGLPEEVIVAKIQGSPCNFDTSSAALATLKSAQVPYAVIVQMVKKSDHELESKPCECRNAMQASATPAPSPEASAPPKTVVTAPKILDKGARARAFDLHFDSGWVYNFDGARAAIITPTGATVSPSHTSHIAPSAGATFWATRYLGLYGDFVFIDGGTASLSFAGISESVSFNLTGIYGGIQLQAPKGSIRPYFDIGAGTLRATTKTTGQFASTSTGSEPTGRVGVGIRAMISKRWGVKAAVEVYRASGGGLNRTYPRIGVGWFFQTKPSGE
jgi:hypothetical protein